MKLAKAIRSSILVIAVLAALVSQAPIAFAGPELQAATIFNRITGTPPKASVQQQMVDRIKAGDVPGAAAIAIQDPNFLNLTVFDMFAATSNKDENNRVVLDDYLATIIGLVRDDANFKEVLYGDVVYVAPTGTWSTDNNTMYSTLAAQPDFSASLVKATQSTVMQPVLSLGAPAGTPSFSDFSGVLTTRGFAIAYYYAGTNRAALRFAGKTFLCHDIDEMSDTTRADYRVRQDVSRQPGGDSTVYRNKCAGCHSGMDGLSGAFAYVNAEEVRVGTALTFRFTATPGSVRAKFFNNQNTFPQGFITKDDSWVNLWADGANEKIGWKGATSGKGIRSFGELYANSDAFASCMAKRVYGRVCFRDPLTVSGPQIDDLTKSFVASGYKMKKLFGDAVSKCVDK